VNCTSAHVAGKTGGTLPGVGQAAPAGAAGIVVAANAPTVLWARNPELATTVNRRHENVDYLEGITLPDTLQGTADIHSACDRADVVVVDEAQPHHLIAEKGLCAFHDSIEHLWQRGPLRNGDLDLGELLEHCLALLEQAHEPDVLLLTQLALGAQRAFLLEHSQGAESHRQAAPHGAQQPGLLCLEALAPGARQDQVTAEVTRIAENRSAIEQTKGMLMVIYGIDEPTAFELLKWRSQETNVKLRLLAEQVAADFLFLSGSETLPPRSAFDNLLLTAHLRMNAENESGDASVLVLPAKEDAG